MPMPTINAPILTCTSSIMHDSYRSNNLQHNDIYKNKISEIPHSSKSLGTCDSFLELLCYVLDQLLFIGVQPLP